jgi:serralysin
VAQTISVQGGNHSIAIYGNGTVFAGNGNDRIDIKGNGKIIVGNGRDTMAIEGNGTVHAGNGSDLITLFGGGSVVAGNGNDSISLCSDVPGASQDDRVSVGSGNDMVSLYANGHMTVGGGNDTLNLYDTGVIHQIGSGGHDTINLGTGNDTIHEQGQATVWGSFSHGTFGAATINGGELKVIHSGGVTEDIAVSGTMTLQGSNAPTEFIGGTGTTVMKWGAGHDTFVGGSGHDTMIGAYSHNVFEFLASESGGQHVIQNFVSGDQLYVEGHTLSYLQAHNDISKDSHGNTIISIDGGKTTIELQGVSSLKGSDFTTHKS